MSALPQPTPPTLTAQFASVPQGPLVVASACDPQIQLSVIVPTYQEAENIASFLQAACAVLDPLLANAYELIVVDDDSPDGTLDLAAAIAIHHPQIRLMRRLRQRELATAVVRGWQIATGKVLATVNADFQHPPALLKEMWNLIHDADLVIASRYCAGASVGRWAMNRRVLSSGAHALGRFILPKAFSRTTDPLSGCFMVRRTAIAGVQLNPIGYKSLIEVLVRGRAKHIAECAYEMQSRTRGVSKASPARSLDYLRQLMRLRKAYLKGPQ